MSRGKKETPTLNIQCFIRVRPLVGKEKRATALEFSSKEVVVKSSSVGSKSGKTLTYDRVFDQDVKQVNVYNTVVQPMVKEVLQGYNCTVFAYGQTGTGKTYTMTGEDSENKTSTWEQSTHSGIIPRAMQDLFEELSKQECEYHVSVSYIELYNERLRSLLKDSTEDVNIQLIDDTEGGVLLKGLTPTPVKTKEDAFKLLKEGSERRQMAATLMNQNSSRSHTIFTINVNIKENVVDEKDDVLRIGKLHLVDLAGSENVTKSGANEAGIKSGGVYRRLTEASNINKSLLTLGRVITSITENNPHIPYRESKLTRFLMDSLGGRTKTCIIGTISPAQSNLDETESTLNYTFKARSIKNKPEKNHKISKKEFMQVASEEITKLKRDLEAVRQGDGFYISKESYEDMKNRMKELDQQIKDWHDRHNKITESYEKQKDLFSSLSADFDFKCAEYRELETAYFVEGEKLKKQLDEKSKEVVVREFFIKEYEKTENTLTSQSKQCKSVLEHLLEQSNKLHDKIERKSDKEIMNMKVLDDFKENTVRKLDRFQEELTKFYVKEKQFVSGVSAFAATIFDRVNEDGEVIMEKLKEFQTSIESYISRVTETNNSVIKDLQHQLKTHNQEIKEQKKSELRSLKILVNTSIHPASMAVKEIFRDLLEKVEKSMRTVKEQRVVHNSIQQETKRHLSDLRIVIDGLSTQSATLRTHITDVIAKTTHAEENSELMFQKLNELKKMTEELEGMVSTSQQQTAASRSDLNLAIGDLDAFDTMLNAGVVNVAQQELTQANLCHSDQTATTTQENLLKETKTLAVNLTRTQDNLARKLKKNVHKRVAERSTFYDAEKSHDAIIDQMGKILKQNFQSAMKEVREKAQTQLEGAEKSVELTGQNIEGILRQENTIVYENLAKIETYEKVIGVRVSDLSQDIQRMSYVMDEPLGLTPQRVTKEQLLYPKKFHATASKEELLKKFNNLKVETTPSTSKPMVEKKGADCIPTEANTTGSVYAEAFQEPLAPLKLQQTKRPVKRHSRSLPDLTIEPSPAQEDKENITKNRNMKNKKLETNLKRLKKPVLSPHNFII